MGARPVQEAGGSTRAYFLWLLEEGGQQFLHTAPQLWALDLCRKQGGAHARDFLWVLEEGGQQLYTQRPSYGR